MAASSVPAGFVDKPVGRNGRARFQCDDWRQLKIEVALGNGMGGRKLGPGIGDDQLGKFPQVIAYHHILVIKVARFDDMD